MADVSRGTVSQVVTGLLTLTNDAYHQGPGISKSHLDVVAISPHHYWSAYLNPKRKPRVPTDAMVLGSAIHAAVLEPDLFPRQFVLAPDISRRSNAGKAEHAQFIAANAGKAVLDEKQWEVAMGVRDAVAADPECRKLLKRGMPEQSFLARDPETGQLIKARTDWLNWQDSQVVDVKSTQDASADFITSAFGFRYHVQQPWYLDVIHEAIGEEPPKDWVFLAVEKTPPYAIGLYRLPASMVAAGRRRARADLERIVNCKMLDDWPSYTSTGPVELDVPKWMQQRLGIGSAEEAFMEGT